MGFNSGFKGLRGKRPVGKPRSRWDCNVQKVVLSMLYVQNWTVQSRQTWRKKTGEVMTRIRAETPKERESVREVRRGEERREDREISI